MRDKGREREGGIVMGLPCLSAVQEEKDGSRQKRAAQQWRRKIKGKRAGGDTKRRERQKMAESPTSFRKSLPPPSLSLTFFAASESKKLFWVGGKRGDESERGKRNWTFIRRRPKKTRHPCIVRPLTHTREGYDKERVLLSPSSSPSISSSLQREKSNS